MLSDRLFILSFYSLFIISIVQTISSILLMMLVHPILSRTRVNSYSSTPLGQNVFVSRCSFYIFLYNLDKRCHQKWFSQIHGIKRLSYVVYTS